MQVHPNNTEKCENNKNIDGMLSSPPETDNLETLSNRMNKRSKLYKKDHRFLKKLNAPLVGIECSIDKFVDCKSNKNGDDSEDDDEYSMNTFKDWKCDICNKDLVYLKKEAQRVCTLCGKSSPFQEMTKEDIIRQGYVNQTAYLYKRQNHFKTWLKRTQGKETTFIDDEIIEKVRAELKKQRISDYSTVTHTKVREILKKLRLNKHYNHCVQITSIITGITPPQMTEEQETALLQMFESIQEPFQRIIHNEPRQNMLSYSFLIHKFLEIMSWDEYLPYFPLLRSVDKIIYQDWIWNKICNEVGFGYIKSTM